MADIPTREWFRPPYQTLTYLTNTSGEIIPADALQDDIFDPADNDDEDKFRG